jgi:predicted dehydrogenase
MDCSHHKLGIGIIGCGKVAFERQLPALHLLPMAQVVAAADPDLCRVQKLCDQYTVPHHYTDYRELIQNPQVDVVAVLTPTGTHAEIGLAVMEANKHLFMEKPLALTVEECDRLVQKSRQISAKSIICFNLRWHRLIQQTQAIVKSGKLGHIFTVRGAYTHFRDGSKAQPWHRTLNSGGGVTFNESVHNTDLFRFLLKSEVTEVFALHDSDQYYQDVTDVMCLRFSDHCLASAFNTLKTSPNSELELIGDKGRLCVNLYRFDGLDFYPSNQYPGNLVARAKKIPYTLCQFAQALKRRKTGGDFQATFYQIWHHFLDCIIHDKQPLVTLEDGRYATQISLAAIESFRSKNVVQLA